MLQTWGDACQVLDRRSSPIGVPDGSSQCTGIWPWMTFCIWDLALTVTWRSPPGAGDWTSPKLCFVSCFGVLTVLTTRLKKNTSQTEGEEGEKGRVWNPMTNSLQPISFQFRRTTTLLCEPTWMHTVRRRWFKLRVLQINQSEWTLEMAFHI